jgi:hypothetical protein
MLCLDGLFSNTSSLPDLTQELCYIPLPVFTLRQTSPSKAQDGMGATGEARG